MAISELPTVEEWDDHKFLGWYTAEEGGSVVTPETIITSNVTFYAHWKYVSLGGITGATNVAWRTGGAAEWTAEETNGEWSMRSGAVADKQKSELKTSVVGPGTVSFWCKTSSERDEADGEVYDGLAVEVDGKDAIGGLLGGELGWTNLTVAVVGEGEHVVCWRYEKDKTGKAGDDCAWLDEVLWQADRAVVTADETGGREVTIGREWIERDLVARFGAGKTEAFRKAFGNDYDLAVRKPTGKTMDGRPASVWHDYVAGTDPLETNSLFTASIEMRGGVPVVAWSPDLKDERGYSVWGKTNLADACWCSPTNSAHRFFKVTVEMK